MRLNGKGNCLLLISCKALGHLPSVLQLPGGMGRGEHFCAVGVGGAWREELGGEPRGG